MSNQFNYPAILIKQKDGGYLVKFPDFSEAITQGNTKEDALNQAIDCLKKLLLTVLK